MENWFRLQCVLTVHASTTYVDIGVDEKVIENVCILMEATTSKGKI